MWGASKSRQIIFSGTAGHFQPIFFISSMSGNHPEPQESRLLKTPPPCRHIPQHLCHGNEAQSLGVAILPSSSGQSEFLRTPRCCHGNRMPPLRSSHHPYLWTAECPRWLWCRPKAGWNPARRNYHQSVGAAKERKERGKLECMCLWWSKIMNIRVRSQAGQGDQNKTGRCLCGYVHTFSVVTSYEFSRKQNTVRAVFQER